MEKVATNDTCLRKRPRSPDSSSDERAIVKLAEVRSNTIGQKWFYVLEPVTEEHIQDTDDSESIYSYQDKSTDYVQDTPDTCTSYDSGDTSMVEFEVESLCDSELIPHVPGFSCDSLTESQVSLRLVYDMSDYEDERSSEDGDKSNGDISESRLTAEALSGAGYSSQGGILIKPSNSNLSGILSSANNKLCLHCKKPKAVPEFVYCTQCFRLKKNFYPPRPTGYRNRRKLKSANNIEKLKHSTSGIGSSAALTTDGGEQISSTSLLDSLEGKQVIDHKPVSCHSKSSSSSLWDFDDNRTSVSETVKCAVCLTLPLNSAFLHSRIAHVYACFPCSMKIWRQSGRCPLCNNKVQKVIRLIS